MIHSRDSQSRFTVALGALMVLEHCLFTHPTLFRSSGITPPIEENRQENTMLHEDFALHEVSLT
jgi:hypothetical protein